MMDDLSTLTHLKIPLSFYNIQYIHHTERLFYLEEVNG